MNILDLNDDCTGEICQYLSDYEFIKLTETCKSFSYKTKLKQLILSYDILLVKSLESKYIFTKCEYLHPYKFHHHNFIPGTIPLTINHLTVNHFPNKKIPEHIKSIEIVVTSLFERDLNEHDPVLQLDAFVHLPTTLEKLIIKNEVQSIQWDFYNRINWDFLPKSLLDFTLDGAIVCSGLLDKLPKVKRIAMINVEDTAHNMVVDIKYLQQYLIKYKQLEEYNVIIPNHYNLNINLSSSSVISCTLNGVKL